jgi:hypothetical protein
MVLRAWLSPRAILLHGLRRSIFVTRLPRQFFSPIGREEPLGQGFFPAPGQLCRLFLTFLSPVVHFRNNFQHFPTSFPTTSSIPFSHLAIPHIATPTTDNFFRRSPTVSSSLPPGTSTNYWFMHDKMLFSKSYIFKVAVRLSSYRLHERSSAIYFLNDYLQPRTIFLFLQLLYSFIWDDSALIFEYIFRHPCIEALSHFFTAFLYKYGSTTSTTTPWH